MTTTAAANVDLLRGLYQLLTDGDIDQAAEHLTEDFVANQPGRPEPTIGRDPWKQGTQYMLSAFPDLKVTIDEIFGHEDKVVVRLHFDGTHQGPFVDIPPTQRKVTFRSLELYRIKDGKVAEEWVAPDTMDLMRQLTT
ncbi:ester cyclase [Kribbella sp. NPDC056345]|uniref:ester cyclase n=1 Tax=Kribbella sp. NPDC056345 TaxID=3345789 RepID=UPI0035DE889A